MSKADDFFQSPAWDEAAQAELEVRIRRVPRKSRLRRYADKAWALFYRSGDDRARQHAAIALIERAVGENGVVPDEGPHELLTVAGYAVHLGDRAAAIGPCSRRTISSVHICRSSARMSVALSSVRAAAAGRSTPR